MNNIASAAASENQSYGAALVPRSSQLKTSHKPIMSLHKATTQSHYPNKLTTQTHNQNKLTTQINSLPKPKSGMICLREVISWEERGTNAAP